MIPLQKENDKKHPSGEETVTLEERERKRRRFQTEMMNIIKPGLLEVVVAVTSTTHSHEEEGREIRRR